MVLSLINQKAPERFEASRSFYAYHTSVFIIIHDNTRFGFITLHNFTF